MRARSFRSIGIACLLVAGVAAWSAAQAQLQPIVMGSGDIPESAGPSACERNFGNDTLGAWFMQLIQPLCKRGTSDALLAVYLFTLPGMASSNGQMDNRLLQRAYAQDDTDPKLLWLVATQARCAGMFAGCPAAQKAVKAAQQLTVVDPDNAMAWFALARAHDWATSDPEKVDAALAQAAKASRVHDYSFDLIQLAAKTSASVTTKGIGTKESASIRWMIVTLIPDLNEQFKEWVGRCSVNYDEGDPDRKRFCRAAQEQFKHGDSLMTLSGDTQAQATIKSVMNTPHGADETRFRQIMLDTIGDSSDEREWCVKTAAKFAITPAGH
ncbi:MAG: hypothetical protein ACREPN_06680 [Rudaea sp.]